MARWVLVALALLCLTPVGLTPMGLTPVGLTSVARADELELPGIAADAAAYQRHLQAANPAGGTPRARIAAEDAAAAAAARGDAAGRAAALERRAGLGQVSGAIWLALADALTHLAPPDHAHAALAAWLAVRAAGDDNAGDSAAGNGATGDSAAGDSAGRRVPALLALASALRGQGRDAQAVEVLQKAVELTPDDAANRRLLADAERAAGLTVRRATVEGEADPPRGCIAFSVPPSRRADLDPADWVRLDPPVPGAAVTREGDQFCVSGLPSGAVTRAIVRAGLPAAPGDAGAGLTLLRDAVVAFDVPNRLPRVVFDGRRFVLPAGQSPTVPLTTVNLSAVALRLIRLSERNVADFVRDHRLGEPVDAWEARYQGEQNGSTVWRGRAAIPAWRQNQAAHTALPLPPPLLTAGPGLYALIAGPGDGTPDDGTGTQAVQLILRTDLAPTVWRGGDGLTVQVRGYSDAAVRVGARLRLLARNNDVLAETVTDADGVGRFAAPLLHGDGPLAPALLEAFGPADDYVALDLNAAAFDLSDRGVSGAADPGPLDAFVWTDRGIYRPGETVRVQALLRDHAGAPADLPVRVSVKRPNGQVFAETTPPRGGGASLLLPVRLSSGAAAGTWTIELRADPKAPPIGTAQFRVDAFVPDRPAVEFGALPAALVAGADVALPVTARFLYGAPGSGLGGHGYATVNVDPAPFPALSGYRFGLEDDVVVPQPQNAPLPPTDAQGATRYTPSLADIPDTTHPLKADVVVEIDDPAGHASKAAVSLPVRGRAPLIGIRPAFPGGEIDADSEAAFDIVAVGPDGAARGMDARVRLVRERPDWRMVLNGRLARYETVYRDEPLETRDVTLTADHPLRVVKTLGFGRYRLEVAQIGGLAATSVRFRAGWADADSPDVPDRVDVSAATSVVPVGGVARVHVVPPFAGKATVLVLSDRVLSLRTLDLPASGTDIAVPVEASWGPGAYVAVHVFRPASGAGDRPARAIGLTWVGVDPAARALSVTLDVPDKLPPRARAVVPVRAAPGAWVSLAAVDEGILRLTRFASPDPVPHFLGRRRLGLDIRDDWGRLIAPADGLATTLRQGGDQGGFALPDVPIRTLTLFAPPVQAGPDGVAAIPLDLPDFNGQARLMAVAWDGDRVGAASRDVLVRDRLVAEPLTPRFLAPGDTTEFAVLLDNLDLPPGPARVVVTVGGPLMLPDGGLLTADLARGGRAVPATRLVATGVGRGTVRIDVTGPDGFAVTHEVALTIRPSRGTISLVAGQTIAPGAAAVLTPPLAADRFVAGTAVLRATFGAPVHYDTAAIAAALQRYPLACLEQTASQALALAFRPDPPAGALAAAVASILDRQRYDGGFALWSANGEAEPWLSAYAMDVLLRARERGVTVPEAAFDDALRFLGEQADRQPDGPDERAAQAYRLYVLAKAGEGRPGVARVLAEAPDTLPTPLARAQLGAALALAHDAPRARAMFTAALASPARTWWAVDYGTALRDQAAITVLLRESLMLPDRVGGVVAALPGANQNADALSTQEQAWLIAAAGALRRDAAPPRVSLNGQDLAPGPGGAVTTALSGPATARNLGTAPVWVSVSASGVPVEPPPAARARMRVSRRFLTLDGGTLDLDHLTRNTVFVVLLEGRAEDAQEHRAMLSQGLPAGWEIAGPLAGTPEAMPFLGALTPTEATPSADDRYAAVLALTPAHPDFRVAVRLRATTPGDYELPGAELSDMYRPSMFARQATNRIKVLPGP